jgi:phosphoglycerol transferase MdoB-like AlkP superfamily enzyme
MESAPKRRYSRWTESQLFLAALMTPTVLFSLGLQVLRIVSHFEVLVQVKSVGWLTGFALVGSTFAFNGALTLGSGVLLLVRDQGSKRWFALAALLQALMLACALVNLSSYAYFVQTADALDGSLLLQILDDPDDLRLLLTGAVTPFQFLLIGLVFLLLVIWPWAVRYRARRSPLPPYPGRERRSRKYALVSVALAGPVAALAALPPVVPVTDLALVRSPVFHVLLTAHKESLVQSQEGLNEATLSQARSFEPGGLSLKPRPAGARPRNLVIVVLESTRASATSVYNPALQTTPFLRKLAAAGLVVDKAYALMPSTAKSLTAIFCSLHPSPQIQPTSLSAELLGACMPRLLAKQGYQTLYLQSANERFENRVAAVANMGFATFIRSGQLPTEGFQVANFLGYEDESMLGPSEAWLQAHKNGPIFAAYLTNNAHHDYNLISRHGVLQTGGEDETYQRYLNNVRATDYFLAALFEQYKRAGLYENTLFLVVGDHGEGFGEHGRRAHNAVPYQEGLWVPLVLFDPSGAVVKPGHLPGPATQLDILPTVLPLLGFELQGSPHGVSLFKQAPNRVVMARCYGYCAARITAESSFITHGDRRPDELFDLRADPLEQNDLAAQHPSEVARYRQDLLTFQRRLDAFYFLNSVRGNEQSRAAKSAAAAP